jgi:hypothetical protein
MRVWVMSKGEDHEGGEVLGVYATKDVARPDFEREAAAINSHPAFRLDSAYVEPDGAVYVHGGCDWLRLDPHEVMGPLELTG